MEDIIRSIRSELTGKMEDKVRESGYRFFKEEIKIYGLRSADVTKLSKKWYEQIKHLSKVEIFQLCEELWKSGYLEESFIACNWTYSQRKNFEDNDFDTFGRWINSYISNWASCDTFCNHTMGHFIEMFPHRTDDLKRWTQSSNRWVRRASAVSLIIPAKKGNFTAEVFDIASLLLTDGDDMVQKGYGWLLKVTSQAGPGHRQMVFDYVIGHKAVMPRTALRYAIEKMPQEMRKEAMKR
jgi:3-methyladenine DNA glycosylase AlkD